MWSNWRLTHGVINIDMWCNKILTCGVKNIDTWCNKIWAWMPRQPAAMWMTCQLLAWMTCQKPTWMGHVDPEIPWWKFFHHRKKQFCDVFERFVTGTQTWCLFYDKVKFITNSLQNFLCDEFDLYNDESHSKLRFPQVITLVTRIFFTSLM